MNPEFRRQDQAQDTQAGLKSYSLAAKAKWEALNKLDGGDQPWGYAVSRGQGMRRKKGRGQRGECQRRQEAKCAVQEVEGINTVSTQVPWVAWNAEWKLRWTSVQRMQELETAILLMIFFLLCIFTARISEFDLFQSCGHCWVFQICWHMACSTFTASSFRIWNSSTGIPSPPLALFVVMLFKAHLTSHSKMSGSRWVITPSWLSWSWDLFCTGLLCILATSS